MYVDEFELAWVLSLRQKLMVAASSEVMGPEPDCQIRSEAQRLVQDSHTELKANISVGQPPFL